MGRNRFSPFAWGVLAYSLLVIAWGYFLRVSESGDGCGTDWPLCRGSIVPVEAQFPTWVEFTHRVSSGLVLILVVAMLIWARRAFDRKHPVAKAASAALLFTVTESLFGALLVVYGWVAGDISTGRILIRPVHVVNTFCLMGSLALTAWWGSRGLERFTAAWRPETRRLRAAGIALLLLAATGSWTGLASTAFPAETLGEGLAQYLDPQHLLVYLRTVHPVLAVLSVALLWNATRAASRRSNSTGSRWLARGTLSLASIQLLLGPLTIALLHPIWLRMLHLVVADVTWVVLIFLWAAVEEELFIAERSYPPPSGFVRNRPGAALP